MVNRIQWMVNELSHLGVGVNECNNYLINVIMFNECLKSRLIVLSERLMSCDI
jgi:hypothetical protein